MVAKKKLGNGFNGFQVPFIPKSRRSARRRIPFKEEAGDGQTCAFELLASLAGKLLQESASSSASSNASEENHCLAVGQGVFEQQRQDKVKSSAMEDIHLGKSAESILMTEVASQNSRQKCLVQAETDAILERTSVSNKSDCWEKTEAHVKSEICKWENKLGHYSNILTEAPKCFGEPYDCNINNEYKQEEAGSSGIKGPTLANKCSLKDPVELCVSSHALVDSKSNVKSPFYRESFPNAFFSRHGSDNILGFRDDDENFLRCNKVSTKPKAFRSARQRIRKLLTSKCWKATPKLKDCELSRSDMGVRPLYCKRKKTSYNLESYHDDTLSKRRKFLDRCSVVTSDRGFSSDSVSISPEKGMGGHNPSLSAKPHVSKDSHVKFSIKSFKIPELYIEVPETATVGSLERTVMEAVMAIIGGGVHVGVFLQGKKVRDDNKTLLQTGISSQENIDTLGFMLEPGSLQASPAVCIGDPSQCETSQPTRSLGTAVLDSGTTDVLCDSSLLTNTANHFESNNESISSQTDPVIDKITPDCRALLPVPARSTEPLTLVPMAQKTKRSELVQRRTRRPFSVSEVEALVEAVEELGTGRWRDVKLRAFENADHRTYVDLKDKWKTLVHTARISPQQRRGEPVPQELLDRVLTAHAYWSQHHAKQNGKQSAATMRITEESSGEKHRVDAIQPLVMIM